MKSTVTTLLAPALVIRFETNFAEIEVRGATFLSVLRNQNKELQL